MSEQLEKRQQVREMVRKVLDGVETNVSGESTNPASEIGKAFNGRPEKEFDRDESAKPLLTEDDFRGLEIGAKVRVAENVKLTPSAKDFVDANKLELVEKRSRTDSLKVKTVGIGCDHGGFELKENLKAFLRSYDLLVRDFGTNSGDAVDYPDFAHAVAEAVSNGKVDVGIVIDGAGIGSAMAAGKVPGVRPAACYNVALAKNSREHNGANVLTLGSGQNTPAEAKEIVHAFLTAEITEARHKKRVGKIDAIERQYKK